jgi:hypothetical protein
VSLTSPLDFLFESTLHLSFPFSLSLSLRLQRLKINLNDSGVSHTEINLQGNLGWRLLFLTKVFFLSAPLVKFCDCILNEIEDRHEIV